MKTANALLCACLVAAALWPPAAQAASYLDNAALASQVREGVRDCRPAGSVRLPLITWGADQVTIHANGGRTTRSGSLFAGKGLNLSLYREDKFADQVRAYLACETPFLRATVGMAGMAADLTESDPRTRMVAIYQHSWSAGGDALVVRDDIRRPADLRGKTIVVQRYGPHVDYLMKVLSDAGLKPEDVKVRWVRDLTGGDETPAAAFRADGTIGAAMVIIPDALALTSDGTVGTGSEGSVKGAHILLSTKSANRIISDMYFVRRDYFDANPKAVQDFVSALLEAEEQVRAMARAGGPDWDRLMRSSAEILLDDANAVEDAKALSADAETTGRQGNARYFADFNYPRSFTRVMREAQSLLRGLGQTAGTYRIATADWDWQRITGVRDVTATTAGRFDPTVTNRVVGRLVEQGQIEDDTLFNLEILFKPNQSDFSAALYQRDFDRVIDLISTYSGAVITVEGHADPLGYLRRLQQMEKAGQVDKVVLNRMIQSARNLSMVRSQEVRDQIIEHGKTKGVVLDPSQFVTIGMGYEAPKTGICGDRPCPPKTEQDWLSNMRVQFRIVNVEAEASAFVPLAQ